MGKRVAGRKAKRFAQRGPSSLILRGEFQASSPRIGLRISSSSLTVRVGWESAGEVMFARWNFQVAATLAVLSILTMPQAARAYTVEQQQYCTGDAFRLCGSEIPDIDRITSCMIRNRSQLSPECRRVFAATPSAGGGERVEVRRASVRKLRMHRVKRPQSADAG
jgi:hypothetical protein